ncbi:MAG: hypothetical protein HRU51_01820 [Xanthomonadales bacterium]|nr:hypothetical protein [Xanthomonadales bacterium]
MALETSFVLLLAVILSSGLVAAYLGLARRYLPPDEPGERSSHERATPTGAGIVCVLTLVLLLPSGNYPFAWMQLLLPAAALLALLGLIDDLRPLSAALRLLLQALLALTVLVFLPFSVPSWSLVLMFLWLLWSVNSFNFMDGSNGMAALQGISSSLLLAFCFGRADLAEWMLAALSVVAVCAGFLPWNFPRARVFLGDAGSLPLGWLLAGLTMVAVLLGALSLPLALLVMALFHVDAGMTLLTRMLRGDEWYTAHREHIYQRMLSVRGGHSRVALIYQAVNIAIIYPLVIFAGDLGAWQWIASASTLAVLAGTWSVLSQKWPPRLMEER